MIGERGIFCRVQPFWQVKPFSLHISLLLFVFIYASLGGFIIQRLEYDVMVENERLDLETRRHCVEQILANLPPSQTNQNMTVDRIAECFKVVIDERSRWGLTTGTLYGFGIITTLGYNRIEPKRLESRLFCVCYGLIGIPITMIIIANIGQYLNQFAGDTRRKLEAHLRRRRRVSKISISEEDIPDTTTELMALALLITFLIYVCIGAVLLPLLNGEFDFLNGIYFNFLCLTAIDFGQLVPIEYAYLPITFIYVCVGLAITTIAINIGSEYVKRLHYFGKKMKNVASTKIWFGGKTLRVKDLLHAVGKKCGVDPHMIDNMNLENIVERVVAIHEGREPPPDINPDVSPLRSASPSESTEEEEETTLSDDDYEEEEPPPVPTSEPPRELIIQNPRIETVSHNSSSLNLIVPFNVGNFVAIDMDIPDEYLAEQALDWNAAPFVISRPDEKVVERDNGFASPDELGRHSPIVLHHPGDQEPRRFKEKKKKYGRDPKRLYATYQEEWERLERLGTKLGPRRKSLLALSPTASRDASMENLRERAGSAGVTDHTAPPLPTKKRSASKVLKTAAVADASDEQPQDSNHQQQQTGSATDVAQPTEGAKVARPKTRKKVLRKAVKAKDGITNNEKEKTPRSKSANPLKTEPKESATEKAPSVPADEKRPSLKPREHTPLPETIGQKPLTTAKPNNLMVQRSPVMDMKRFTSDRRTSTGAPRKLSPQIFQKFGEVAIKRPSEVDVEKATEVAAAQAEKANH